MLHYEIFASRFIDVNKAFLCESSIYLGIITLNLTMYNNLSYLLTAKSKLCTYRNYFPSETLIPIGVELNPAIFNRDGMPHCVYIEIECTLEAVMTM
jgi:hypothetical protein